MKRILATEKSAILVLVIPLGILLSSGLAFGDEWYEIYKSAISDLERGEWQKAEAKLQEALKSKDKPEAQAATSGLSMVDYLPHYYLGQAYFFAGDYAKALASFNKSKAASAIRRTKFLPVLEKYITTAEQLLAYSDLRKKSEKDPALEQDVIALRNLISAGKSREAAAVLAQLKRQRPEDPRWAIFESWLGREDTRPREESKPTVSTGPAELSFGRGLDHYVIGQYQQALDEFSAAEKLDPNFGAARNWIQKTQTEMQRLKLDIERPAVKTPEPEIIEKIIRETTTTAPVFAIRSPTESASEVRSKTLELSGQVGDDHGIDYLEVTVNGKPLLNDLGQIEIIKPQASDDAKQFSFSAQIPLQLGENQIVLLAYDVDSPPQQNSKHYSVIRKPPIYQTTSFAVSVAALLLLGTGGVVISRIIKYRIAIVNKYNPYIAGSPIRTEEMFFGREKLIQRILNTLHNNSLMIYGPRRIGKTSLQHHLRRRLEALQDPEFQFIPVMIDLQGTSEDRFFATLMEEILETCKVKVNGALSLRLLDKKHDYSGRDFSSDIKKLLQLLTNNTDKKLKLVLLMDEVDELNKYSERVNQKLRSVFMKTFAENLVAVMSGAYIRKSWESEGSPWYNFFEEVEVPPFQREDAIALIRKPVEGIFSYEEAAIEKIIEFSECKPYTIQRICVNAINLIIEHKRRKVTVADVEAVFGQILRTSEQSEVKEEKLVRAS